jgi:hypothetical protein
VPYWVGFLPFVVVGAALAIWPRPLASSIDRNRPFAERTGEEGPDGPPSKTVTTVRLIACSMLLLGAIGLLTSWSSG